MRAALEDAFDESKVRARALRAQLRVFETAARKAIAGGSLSSVSANGRTSQFAPSGAGNLTTADTVELWRELITLHDKARRWLTWCFNRGLDPQSAEADGVTSADTVAEPTEVTDADIIEWMLGSEAIDDSERCWIGMPKLSDTRIDSAMTDYSEATV